jgi:hypothetical protein
LGLYDDYFDLAQLEQAFPSEGAGRASIISTVPHVYGRFLIRYKCISHGRRASSLCGRVPAVVEEGARR